MVAHELCGCLMQRLLEIASLERLSVELHDHGSPPQSRSCPKPIGQSRPKISPFQGVISEASRRAAIGLAGCASRLEKIWGRRRLTARNVRFWPVADLIASGSVVSIRHTR